MILEGVLRLCEAHCDALEVDGAVHACMYVNVYM